MERGGRARPHQGPHNTTIFQSAEGAGGGVKQQRRAGRGHHSLNGSRRGDTIDSGDAISSCVNYRARVLLTILAVRSLRADANKIFVIVM